MASIRSAGEPSAGSARYLSEPITTGLVPSAARTASMSRWAIPRPGALVESGISLPMDHMTTAGELRAARTISVMSASQYSSKKRP
ncbi:hypothetical protein Z951_31505 [Streptomyces sp. PRh5]|nr:hypothetical protein Z951_31505 [Streptomyces sp. PRh5]